MTGNKLIDCITAAIIPRLELHLLNGNTVSLREVSCFHSYVLFLVLSTQGHCVVILRIQTLDNCFEGNSRWVCVVEDGNQVLNSVEYSLLVFGGIEKLECHFRLPSDIASWRKLGFCVGLFFRLYPYGRCLLLISIAAAASSIGMACWYLFGMASSSRSRVLTTKSFSCSFIFFVLLFTLDWFLVLCNRPHQVNYIGWKLPLFFVSNRTFQCPYVIHHLWDTSGEPSFS